ncbi:MAG TPA: hypothetical protein VMW58_13430 [Anaerolineae bacterium]|nr:hypothetical protein [Anaerolineae bacterium]
MTESPENVAPFSPGPASDLLRFRVPEVQEVEVFLARLPDGRIVARTTEELGPESEITPRGGQ